MAKNIVIRSHYPFSSAGAGLKLFDREWIEIKSKQANDISVESKFQQLMSQNECNVIKYILISLNFKYFDKNI